MVDMILECAKIHAISQRFDTVSMSK
jgi:hypothetical protein